MTQPHGQTGHEAALEDVLNEFAAELEDTGRSYALLKNWTARYPAYEQQLAELAVDEALLRYSLPSSEELDDERLLQAGLDAAQGALERARQERPAVAPAQVGLPGLMVRAREVGLNIREVADRSQLSVTLVGLLDRRLVRFGSIQTQVASVVQYLQQSPSFAPSASFRAEEAPTLPLTQDLSDAVRQDPTLDENHRAALLRLSPPASS